MSRSKKVLLLILGFVLISQIPFAYRRYRLGRLNAAIQSISSTRVSTENTNAPFREYKGVMHVHSFLGGHSTGTFQEIIAGAKTNQLDFVIMTEHVESGFDTSALTLSGTHEGVLFVNGNEVETVSGDRLLSIPGDASLSDPTKHTTTEMFSNIHGRDGLAIIAYPEQFGASSETVADGIEVYNVFTNARKINRLVAFFDALWSHHSYPDLLFANYLQRPDLSLSKWDEMLRQKKLVATAGNDSHSNVGFTLNDSSGNVRLGFKLDPYETSFHLVRVHVLVPRTAHSLDSNELLAALRSGHCFIGFDLLGDTTGFRFEAVNASGTKLPGDDIAFQSDTRLKILAPVSSRIQLMKDGRLISEENGVKAVDWKVTERGIYRVEVYLTQLGSPAGEQPWIISNPIYVR
ncbi:MAG TPA: hypothetical protein VGP85_13375 [Pyrinomonadaceae bacterium]|nr:hypothetical protein [Pyrinomonadaceae bacterium]